ncbi:MAG TPA: RNA polymerase sigma factor [Candidatus Acidoferrales bacterium]|nr:RNA polymerase sigma factor [Candidatus Acidoferrales bacterium]
MAATDSRTSGTTGPWPVFATTHWSVVLAAVDGDGLGARAALSQLCQNYWYPLYAYVRRQGHSPQDAQDLTQAFFLRLLERNWLNAADRERGRFRTFLLTALQRFLADEWDKTRAQKRGGGFIHVPLQQDSFETRYGQEPADTLTPEQCYERRWALTLLDTVLHRVQEEYERDGKGDLFEQLKFCLAGTGESLPYGELAVPLGMSEGAVKVAVHRLRKRYRELLRAEIARTVGCTAEVDEELRQLFRVLAGH